MLCFFRVVVVLWPQGGMNRYAVVMSGMSEYELWTLMKQTQVRAFVCFGPCLLCLNVCCSWWFCASMCCCHYCLHSCWVVPLNRALTTVSGLLPVRRPSPHATGIREERP